MTKSQKNSVDEMLAVGISIPKIAAFLHVSQNSIKSYLQRKHPNDVCLNCGTPVLQVPHRKQKNSAVTLAGCTIGTRIRKKCSMKTQPRFPVRSAESRFSATEIIQENIAPVPVLRKEGINDERN